MRGNTRGIHNIGVISSASNVVVDIGVCYARQRVELVSPTETYVRGCHEKSR